MLTTRITDRIKNLNVALRAALPDVRFPRPSDTEMRNLEECAQPVVAVWLHRDIPASLHIYQNVWEALRTWGTIATNHDTLAGDRVRFWLWASEEEMHWDAPMSRANRTWIELK